MPGRIDRSLGSASDSAPGSVSSGLLGALDSVGWLFSMLLFYRVLPRVRTEDAVSQRIANHEAKS